ncbi:MAG: glutamate--tRNA ligase [Anaerolineales bacterium]|nr:glutamate--tRNA ligase [Anaerolineales bacterium]
MTQKDAVRVRFAPSPTGRFHIGGARTALYNYLLARQTGGKFILRLEDTDRKRFNPASEKEFIDSLHWLGLQWDEGPDIGGPYRPYRQSERRQIYQQHINELIRNDHAYYCFCTPDRLAEVRNEQKNRKEDSHYDGLCRSLSLAEAQARIDSGESYVVRFKTPKEGVTTCYDQMRGEIRVENRTLDDYILLKSNGLPVYHLAAIVDDYLMGITHVFRGSEWLPTFPLHTQIYQAFGWQQPLWMHLSLFLNPTGKGKLSKRQSEGNNIKAVYTLDLKELGFLPEAVNNWIALMGWSYDDHTEFFTLPDLVENFSIEKLNPSPAAVNFTKLDHFNKLHIRSLAQDDLARRLVPVFQQAGLDVSLEKLIDLMPILQERIRTLDEAVEIAGFFFRDWVQPSPEDLIGKNMDQPGSLKTLQAAIEKISSMQSFNLELVEAQLRESADSLGLKAGQFFGILRMAVTGQTVSPPLIESMEIIGFEEVLRRLQKSAEILANSFEL